MKTFFILKLILLSSFFLFGQKEKPNIEIIYKILVFCVSSLSKSEKKEINLKIRNPTVKKGIVKSYFFSYDSSLTYPQIQGGILVLENKSLIASAIIVSINNVDDSLFRSFMLSEYNGFHFLIDSYRNDLGKLDYFDLIKINDEDYKMLLKLDSINIKQYCRNYTDISTIDCFKNKRNKSPILAGFYFLKNNIQKDNAYKFMGFLKTKCGQFNWLTAECLYYLEYKKIISLSETEKMEIAKFNGGKRFIKFRSLENLESIYNK